MKKSVLILVLCSTLMSQRFTVSAAVPCLDDDLYVFGKYVSNGQWKTRTCAWLTEDPQKANNRKARWCNRKRWDNTIVKNKCPEACDECSSPLFEGNTCKDFSPRDLSSSNPLLWHDKSGTRYNCAYYANGRNCEIFGNGYANYGKTAKQACCSCGGGSQN